jgi:hypothetical protein
MKELKITASVSTAIANFNNLFSAKRLLAWDVKSSSFKMLTSFVKFLFKIIGVVLEFRKSKHIEDVLYEPPRLVPLGFVK